MITETAGDLDMPEAREVPESIDGDLLWREVDQQRLLFAVSPTALDFNHRSASPLAAELQARGFAVSHAVPTVQDAFALAMSAIAELGRKEPYSSLGFRECKRRSKNPSVKRPIRSVARE